MPSEYEQSVARAMDRKMSKVPESHRYRFCEPGLMGCGCMGCVNIHGISDKPRWIEWVQRNPSPIGIRGNSDKFIKENK